jgi:hypothetical protein
MDLVIPNRSLCLEIVQQTLSVRAQSDRMCHTNGTIIGPVPVVTGTALKADGWRSVNGRSIRDQIGAQCIF